MGLLDVDGDIDRKRMRDFHGSLLDDLAAIDLMLRRGMFETGVTRLGAEQEMLLVDAEGRLAPISDEVLEDLDTATFTTEIGRFNLEANLAPVELGGDCFQDLESKLDELVKAAREAAARRGARVLLAGILPTARTGDLTLDNLTPRSRYQELNRTVMRLRGGSYGLQINGTDELQLVHDNVMPEACCTSFQLHLQVVPDEFTAFYNAAQLAIGPVLAAAANSPLMLGRRLWHETRIALFQHSVDERTAPRMARAHPPRVTFGERWVVNGVLDLLREQALRYRPIFTQRVAEPSTAQLRRGILPALSALRLHNGTVWRWNRACYGVTPGSDRAHLRIEFRALPSGPTVADEVANAAFLIGLVYGLVEERGDVGGLLPFDAARDNFFGAARHGLSTPLDWLDGRTGVAAARLILDTLLPLAEFGLACAGVDRESANRYLGLIEQRVTGGMSPSQWTLEAARMVAGQGSSLARDRRLVEVLLSRQAIGGPMHFWELPNEAEQRRVCYQTVGDVMATDLATVSPEDPASLALRAMQWRHVRHVPVEDEAGRLAGLVNVADLAEADADASVRDVMMANPVTATPETPLLEALRMMREHGIDCLPVVEPAQGEERLTGIVTSHDMMRVLEGLLEEGGTGRSMSAAASGA